MIESKGNLKYISQLEKDNINDAIIETITNINSSKSLSALIYDKSKIKNPITHKPHAFSNKLLTRASKPRINNTIKEIPDEKQIEDNTILLNHNKTKFNCNFNQNSFKVNFKFFKVESEGEIVKPLFLTQYVKVI